MCCSHLLDFCTRHSGMQDKSEFISNTPRPILSYHLVSPTLTAALFWLTLGRRADAEFCTRYCAATHSVGTGWRSVRGGGPTCSRNFWLWPNVGDRHGASPKREHAFYSLPSLFPAPCPSPTSSGTFPGRWTDPRYRFWLFWSHDRFGLGSRQDLHKVFFVYLSILRRLTK
jgi:hypothetical protein